MSEFTPLREAVDALTGRALSPDFGDLKRRATRRRRRRVAIAAAATVVVIAGTVLASTGLNGDRRAVPAAPAASLEPPKPSPRPAPARNGWVAVEADQDGGGIYLVRPGEDARRLEVAGSGATNDACPAWSPDGTRLLFGRLTVSGTNAGVAQLVVVPVGQDGTAGTPTSIALPGFDVLEGFDAHPCGTWAPDGRWVALASRGEVWVVDTQTGTIRKLPDLRPSDLEWRPGTDELAIAGDLGPNRSAPTLSTPLSVYSVSTGQLRQIDSVQAAHVTWSPDGSTLAFTGGETDPPMLWLIDAEGANKRLLVADLGGADHGIGPVWSPTGDRIAYQRLIPSSREDHNVVLVNVADGTESVIEPPETDGPNGRRVWYPFHVSWSPDGTTLLYAAWSDGQAYEGTIAVRADAPSDATVLAVALPPIPDVYSQQWAPTQIWGRQPG